MTIERCNSIQQPGWLAPRQALWPDSSREEHLAEISSFVADFGRYAQFVAYGSSGEAIGLVEASLRTDYVNRTRSSPVGFLEGLYVVPEQRRTGVAKSLVQTVLDWATGCGCSEFASDALISNKTSHAVHRALGFEETERVIFFRRSLR